MSTRASPHPQRGERTVVMADLTGSSRLFALLGTEAAARFMTQSLDAMTALGRRHGGRAVKRLGDGVLLLFETAQAALQACIALQRGHQSRIAAGPEALRLPLHIGLARGELALVDGDCYGEAVNLAARLSEMAGGGQIWATENVLEGQAATVRTHDLGPMPLSGIAGVHRLFQVEWGEGREAGVPTLHGDLLPAPVHARAGIALRYGEQLAVFGAGQLPIVLGRSAEADLVLRESMVSRRHARIENRDGSLLLTDLSSYGTWLRPQGSAQALPLRRDACLLLDRGEIALGGPFDSPGVPVLAYCLVVSG